MSCLMGSIKAAFAFCMKEMTPATFFAAICLEVNALSWVCIWAPSQCIFSSSSKFTVWFQIVWTCVFSFMCSQVFFWLEVLIALRAVEWIFAEQFFTSAGFSCFFKSSFFWNSWSHLAHQYSVVETLHVWSCKRFLNVLSHVLHLKDLTSVCITGLIVLLIAPVCVILCF